jgi:16S rRNA (cytidine1402-2'-O)-methyltransferase
MNSALYVVATPIGNLGDLTPRARETLATVSAILCEDTRRTSHLLSALGISGKSLERFDAHSSPAKAAKLIERLQAGESFALVTDAGTPSVSDPGSQLVEAAHAAGIAVIPLPGASAPVALLSAAGFSGTAFTFRGFFPRKSGERTNEVRLIEAAARQGLSTIFVYFESPERIKDAFTEIAAQIPQAKAVAAKELTKVYEKFFVGAIGEVSEAILREIEREGARGEWCFALEISGENDTRIKNSSEQIEGESSDWVKALECLIEGQIPASNAVKLICQHFGVPRKTAYDTALRISGKKS